MKIIQYYSILFIRVLGNAEGLELLGEGRALHRLALEEVVVSAPPADEATGANQTKPAEPVGHGSGKDTIE